MNLVSHRNSCFAPLAGMVSRCSSDQLPKSVRIKIRATLLQLGKTLLSVTLTMEFNCITCVLVTWKYKYPWLYGEKRSKENDSKDHFAEFISKYLSSFTCISLRSIDYFSVSRVIPVCLYGHLLNFCMVCSASGENHSWPKWLAHCVLPTIWDCRCKTDINDFTPSKIAV